MTLAKKIKTNFIGDKNFYRQVAVILLPIIIQNTITNVVSLIDNVMVGRVGTLQMSAVAIVNQLLFVFYLCIFGGLAGAGIFTAQFAGAGDKEGVRNTFRMKMYIAGAVLTVAFLVLLLFPEKLVGLYLAEGTAPGDAAATMKYGIDYLKVMLWGIVPFAISQVYGSTLRELEQTKLPMLASVTAILVNIVFNYVLIFGNEGLPFLPFKPLGVVGAAIATVLSRYVEMLIIIFAVHLKQKKYDFIIGVYKTVKIPLSLFTQIAKRGLPLLINEFMWSFGMAALMQSYSVRGIEVVAATNISTTIANLFNVFYISLGTAIGIMVGQQLGAGNKEKAKSTVKKLLAFSFAICSLVALVLFSVSGAVPKLYNTTDSVRELAKYLLWIIAFTMPFDALCHGSYFTIRSGGKTLITMIFDSGFIWLISYPLSYFIAHFTALPIIPFFLIVRSIDILKALAGIILVKSDFWLQSIVDKKDN